MSKEKRILSYFIGWLLVGYIIFVIGSNNVFAATTTTYENIGYLNDVTVLYSLADDPPYPIEIPREGEYQLYNVEKIIVQIDNYTFSGGTTYNLELSLPITTLNNNIYSVIDENGNKCSIGIIDSAGSSYPNYSFNCTKSTNSLTLNIYNTDGSDILNAGIFRWNYIYLRKQLTTTDTSILENQQSQMIEQNQQIIQGQEEIKDTIKDQFESCHMSYNLLRFILSSQTVNGLTITNNGDGSLTLNGTTTDVVSMKISPSMYNLKAGNYSFSINPTGNISNTFTKLIYGIKTSSDTLMTTTNNSESFSISKDYDEYFLWFYIKKDITFNNYTIKPMLNEGTSPIPWEPYGEEICNNRLDETNDKLNDIQGALTDSSAPNTSGLENSAGWLPAGPLDSILNLPLTMLNSLTNSLSKTCNPLNLTLPYVNKQIQIPCLSAIFAQINGVNALWTWVGTIASVLILYNYLLNLYAWVDRVLTLRAEFDEAMGADLANWGRL